MSFDMFGNFHPIIPMNPMYRIRPRFLGWTGFAPDWQDYMDWMGEDDYSLWRRWQEDISDMHLSRMERRRRLLQMLRQEHSFDSRRRIEEMADKMLGMENDLGADEFGHVINRTETTTTTTNHTSVTQMQRDEVANKMVDSAKADPNTNLAQLMQTVKKVRSGQSDDLVRDWLQKMASGQVEQVQQPPPVAPQHAQYGGYQQATQNFQQGVQTPQPQPTYWSAPPQQPTHAPMPQAMQPFQQPAPIQYQAMAPTPPTPAPGPARHQPQTQQGGYAGQQQYSQTSTTTTTTTSSTNAGYASQAQVMQPGHQQHMPQQVPQPLQYQPSMQITQGQSPPPIAYFNQQGQVMQPQMAYGGQAGPNTASPQAYTPQTPAPQHLVSVGQSQAGYTAAPGYPQQAGTLQQQPYQYGQPTSPQEYQPVSAGQQYLGYEQLQQPVYHQEMAPSSSAVTLPMEKKTKKSSSSKKGKK